MANHVHSSQQEVCTRLSDRNSLQTRGFITPPPMTAEVWLAVLIIPALMVIALAGFAQPEVLHHTSAKVQVMEAAR